MINDVQISDRKAVAETFNDYFANIGTNLSKTIYLKVQHHQWNI
jgi:hypothetical protein